MRLGVCLRCLDLWSTIAGRVHCPLGFYGTFGFLSSSRSLQVYSWPRSLFWLVTTCALRRVTWCVLLLASVYAHCGGDWMGFRGNSHVGPVFRWHVVLSPYSRSEPAHPRLMESDDVVCFSLLS